jgi:hypothetical protein
MKFSWNISCNTGPSVRRLGFRCAISGSGGGRWLSVEKERHIPVRESGQGEYDTYREDLSDGH